MFLSVSSLVRLSCGLGTLRYSQDRQAKKKAPIDSCETARVKSVVWLRAILCRIQAGRAFLGFSFGSLFL